MNLDSFLRDQAANGGLDEIKNNVNSTVRSAGETFNALTEMINMLIPAKVQSYMLASKPIIGAINGEVKEVIKDAKCGLCCNSLDYESFAKIILEASKSKKINEWSKNAYNYYLDNFEKEKCIDELENILNKYIKKK